MNGRRVYIAGPYTVGDVARNVAAAVAVADWMLGRGIVPYVPHLTHFWHMLHPQQYETWIAFDLAWLRQCEAVYRMPGESAGADREVAAALCARLPIFYSEARLLNWANPL